MRPDRLAEVAFTMRSKGVPGRRSNPQASMAPPKWRRSASARDTVRLATTSRAGRSFEQGSDDTPGRAACSEQQHFSALEPQSEVGFEIPHQADAIGVVAPRRVALESQSIDGAGPLRPLAHACAQFEGLFLEGQSDVRSEAALGPESGDRLAEAPELHVAPGIDEVVAELASELGVNERRLAVGYRIAHDHVSAGRLVFLHHPGPSFCQSPLVILPRTPGRLEPAAARNYRSGDSETPRCARER